MARLWRWKGPHWRPVGTRRGMGRLPIARCYNSYKCTDRRVSTLPCNLRSSSLCATTAPLHLPSHASSCNSPFPTDIPLLLLIPKIPSQLSSPPIQSPTPTSILPTAKRFLSLLFKERAVDEDTPWKLLTGKLGQLQP